MNGNRFLIMNFKIFKLIKLFYNSFGLYTPKIIIMVILGFLSGILEGVGINIVIPLFALIIKNQSGDTNFITKTIQKVFSFFGLSFGIKYLLIAICVLFILKAVIALTVSYIRVKVAADYEARERSNLFSLFLKTKWPFLLNQKLGHLETLLMTNVHYGSIALEHFCNVAIILVGLLVYLFVALNVSFIVTVFTLLLGSILFVFFKPFFKSTKVSSKDIEEINKKIAHYVGENILGLKTIKITSKGQGVAEKGSAYFKELRNLSVKMGFVRSVGGILIQPVGLIFISIIFAFSYKTANFSLGTMAVIVYLIQRIFTYFQNIQASMGIVAELSSYLQALNDTKKNIKHNLEVNDGSNKFILQKKLEFKNVNFSYGEKQILHNVNFSVNKGEMVGLVGPSGAGKTTATDMILRLFKPNEGEIILDDKDINEIDMKEWRDKVGYVSQDIFLMNDTISNNIKFYNNLINVEDVIQVAKMANIFDFIEQLPQKFDTVIGERGVLLSVGQRQRIVIARVLARKPDFLIMDEATSALDNESELQIQKVIENLKGKITVLVIAHRLSTVIHSDKLIVLENGQVIEEGSPKDLLAIHDSYFSRVYNLRK